MHSISIRYAILKNVLFLIYIFMNRSKLERSIKSIQIKAERVFAAFKECFSCQVSRVFFTAKSGVYIIQNTMVVGGGMAAWEKYKDLGKK